MEDVPGAEAGLEPVVEPTGEVLGVGAAIAGRSPWLALRDHYSLDSIRSSMSREGAARQAVAGVGPSGAVHIV